MKLFSDLHLVKFLDASKPFFFFFNTNIIQRECSTEVSKNVVRYREKNFVGSSKLIMLDAQAGMSKLLATLSSMLERFNYFDGPMQLSLDLYLVKILDISAKRIL